MKIDNGTRELHIQGNESKLEQISRIIILDTTILSLFSVVMLATTLIAFAALNQLDTDLSERDRDQHISSLQVARISPDLPGRFSRFVGFHNFGWKVGSLTLTSNVPVANAGLVRSSSIAPVPFSPSRVGKSEPKVSGPGQNFAAAGAKLGNKCMAQQSTNYVAQLPTSNGSATTDNLQSQGSESWPNTNDIFDAYMISTIY